MQLKRGKSRVNTAVLYDPAAAALYIYYISQKRGHSSF